jgi:PAS domain S-box-containing protein
VVEHDLLQSACEEAARLLRCDGAMTYLLDPADGVLHFANGAGIEDKRALRWLQSLRLAVGVGMFGRAVSERRVVSTGDYDRDASFIHAEGTDRIVENVGMRSMVVAPLIAGEAVLGGLGVFSDMLEAFGPPDIALVRALADHAATAIANRRLIADLDRSREALARQADAERALREIGARISAIRDPAELLQLVVDEAARLLGADGARIDLLDQASGALYWAYDARTGRNPGLGPIKGDGEARAGEGISGRAVSTRRAVWTGDYLADERFSHATMPDAHVRRHGLRSVLAAPLLGDADPFGTLTVFTSVPEAYGPADAALIEALANQAGVAIRSARLFEELERSRTESAHRADAERTLREIAARITAVHDPQAILHLITAEAARLLGHERVFINLLNDPTGATGWTWYSPTEVGRDDWPADESILVGEGITGKAIAERRAFMTGDYLNDDRFIHRPGPDRYTEETGMHSTLAVPMFDGEQPLGAMLVEAPQKHAFREEDATILEALAYQASIAIATARLIEELAASREESGRRARSERTLREIAMRITEIRDPAALLQGILDEAARLLDAERAQIDLVEPVADQAQWTFPTGVAGSRRPGGLPAGGISAWAVEAGRGVATGDYFTDQSFRHTPETDTFVRAAGLVSASAAPLVTDEGLVGVITVGTSRPHAYGLADAERLEVLASQAAVALTTARLLEALARSREESGRRADAEQALREIAAEVTALRDPREVVQLVIRAASKLLDGDVAEIGMADDADPLYASIGASSLPGTDSSIPPSVVAGIGVSGVAYRDRVVFRTGEYVGDDRFEHGTGVDEYMVQQGLRSAISAPLVAEGRAFGAMSVISRRADAFDDDDGDLLQALADQAAIALANARLIGQLERSKEQLARRVETERALREIAGRITALQEPREVLDRIVEEARRLLGSDGAHLTLVSEDRTYLAPVVLAGERDEATEAWMRTQEFPMHGGINGLAAGRDEVVWTADYLEDPRIPHEPDDHEVADRMGIRGMAAAPLRVPGGEVIGTLAISYRQPVAISPDELELLQGLADHAAIALANSRLLERVRASESRYRFLVDQAPDIVFSTDAEGHFTTLSESIEHLLGYPAVEVVGQHFSLLVDAGSMPLAASRWQELVDDPSRDLTSRLELVHRDGRRIPYEVRATGLVEGGVFAGIHGASRDISDRERLEAELRESEARYRYLVKASPDIVWAVDRDGLLTFMSDRLETLTGWSPEEVVGRHFAALTEAQSMPASEETWAAVQADPSGVYPLEVLMPRRDGGEPIPMEVWVTGSTRDDVFAGAHGSMRDLRDRQRLERDLRRQAADLASSQERAHLARELHDSVTQALFSMTLTTRTLELLMDRDATKAKAQLAVLRELQKDALAEMRSLIFELRPGSLEQDGLIHALRTHAAAVEGRVGLPIVLDAEDFDARLPIEVEDACYRIAQEALHNVVKHAAARHVRIELGHVDHGIRLVVEDDGHGFDPQRVPGGHLGLAGMRARAERLGGRLAVASAAGRGTRIEVVLPDTVERSDPAAEVAASDR